MLSRWSSTRALALFLFIAGVAPLATLMAWQLPNSAEHPAIAYSSRTPTDAISELQQKLDAGEIQFEYDEAHGFLPAVLKALKIPVSSQGLVFSKTSLQVERIAPWSPRALYFNDTVYLGWVRGGPIMEVAAVDPKLGTVFYTLAQDPKITKPRFERQTVTCLICHDSNTATGGVPGLIVGSIFPDRTGSTIMPIRKGVTTDQTPMDQRWGGWYVTGKTADQRHLGNIVAPQSAHDIRNPGEYLERLVDPQKTMNRTDLNGLFDVSPFLSGHSDIVALMVLTHQSFIHNMITIAEFETSRALYDEQLLFRGVTTADSGHSEATLGRIRAAAEPLLRALLFVREAPLRGPVKGTSGFAEEFAQRGPFDRQGRSLREFDLKTRLFRYPLSFLVYSDTFDKMQPLLRKALVGRLGEVLTGKDEGVEFAHLSNADRKTILEILRETKPSLLPTD